MVPLALVRESNSQLKKALANPVAVFVGATQGIGLSTLQHYATLTRGPKIYIVGRSSEVGARIIHDLKARNAEGNYVFLKAQVSLLESVDEVCREIERAEDRLDLLFLSPGYLSFRGRDETSEGLDRLLTVRYYARALFVIRLLPLLRNAPCARVLFVLAAGSEGTVFPDDLELKHHYGVISCARTATTMASLFCEEAAARNPGVGFVHAHPGVVKTGALTGPFWPWLGWLLDRTLVPLMTPFTVPLAEVGERSVFHATSARYPARDASADGPVTPGVPLSEGLNVAKGTDGAYLIDWSGEPTENKVLARYREEGLAEKVWDHTCAVIERVRRFKMRNPVLD